MARSRWKLIFFSKSIWRKINIILRNKRLRKRTLFDRSSSIPNCFFLRFVRINKGKKNRNIIIENSMIGKKFGEFSFTRKPFYYPAKKAKKKKNILLRR